MRTGAAPTGDPSGLRRALTIVFGAAPIAVIAGLAVRLSAPDSGFTPAAAAAGLAAQLPVTLPAAILVGGAFTADVAAGAVLVRALRRAPFASLAEAVLAGFAGAVVLDVALLYGLGWAGWFRALPLGLALAAMLGAGWRMRPILARRPHVLRPRYGPGSWLLLALLWGGVVIVALVSPVVPFADVLPNHVAPVAHLRAFGAFPTLATDPDPTYGSSRLFLGYVGLLGVGVGLTQIPAALAAAVVAIPLAVVSAVAMARLASVAFGRQAGFWALVLFPLSFTFVRLNDARDSVTALPLIALAFVALLKRDVTEGGRRSRTWTMAIALTAAFLVHPLVGGLGAATVALVTLADPGRYARVVVPAAVAAPIACLPQLALFLGFDLPSAFGLLALAAAAVALETGVRFVGSARAGPKLDRRTAAVLLASALAIAAAIAFVLRPATLATVGGFIRPSFPLLFGGALVALVLRIGRARDGIRLAAAGAAVGLGALAAAALVPGTSLAVDSFRYEIPKAIGYWLPWICVAPAAGLLAAIARTRRGPGSGAVAAAVVAVTLAIAILPLGPAVPNTFQGEHPAVDALAHDLQIAAAGYWVGYPDPRELVDSAGHAVIAFLDAQEAAGSLLGTDEVLHIAASIERWRSIPIAVFTGAIETMVAPDAVPGIFTTGSRLVPLTGLATALAHHPAWVVLEPADLPSTERTTILDAGYVSVFANARAEVFRARATTLGVP